MIKPTIRFLIRIVPGFLVDLLILAIVGITGRQAFHYVAMWVMVLIVVEIVEEARRAR